MMSVSYRLQQIHFEALALIIFAARGEHWFLKWTFENFMKVFSLKLKPLFLSLNKIKEEEKCK